MLNNVKWGIKDKPFRHAYVRDVFSDDIYRMLCSAFEEKCLKTTSKSRVENYDAIIEPICEEDRTAFFPLLDHQWLGLVRKALGLETTFEIDAAIHSHPPGSRTGWIHNDYNPGWFARPAKPGELLLSSSKDCRYRNGYSDINIPEKICRMRYLTMIFYLNNDGWSAETGGSTGIYSTSSFSGGTPTITIPPINNSLLMFECTPHSWHTFITTSRRRNSVTLWLHRSMESAQKQWPYHEPVYWS